MTPNKKAALVHAGYRGDIEKRRRMIGRLVHVQRMDPKKVAAKLGVSLATVYGDMEILRKHGNEELHQTDINGTPAANVLHDSMAGSNERIRILWRQVDDIQTNYKALIDGLRDPALSTASSGPQHDFAKAIKTYETTMRGLFESIRKEEEHQGKMLQRFGVIGKTSIEINQKITTRDETQMLNSIIEFVNKNLPPERRKDLQRVIRQRIAGPVIDA